MNANITRNAPKLTARWQTTAVGAATHPSVVPVYGSDGKVTGHVVVERLPEGGARVQWTPLHGDPGAALVVP